MTLIDTRPGIAAVWDALSAETGVVDRQRRAVSRLGPPLDEELARWFPAERVAAMGDRFRALYPDAGGRADAGRCRAPREAVDAVHAARRHAVVVVTGKYEPNARLHLDHLGLDVDDAGRLAVGPEQGRGAARARRDGLRRRPPRRRRGRAGGGRASASRVATGPVSADELRRGRRRRRPRRPDGVPGLARRARAATPPGRPATSTLARSARSRSRSPAAPTPPSCWRPPCAPSGPSNVVAATAVSCQPAGGRARRGRCGFAADLGVRHVIPATDELAREGYRGQRRRPLLLLQGRAARRACGPLADRARASAHVATGTNADDAVAGFRPGIRAAAERGAVTPLLRRRAHQGAGAGGQPARWGLRDLGQAGRSLPVQPGRVRGGDHPGPAGAGRAGRGGAPRGAGRRGRSRCPTCGCATSATRARVEVDAAAVAAVAASDGACSTRCATAGFAEVEVDPRGFRSGAMNELLPDPEPLPLTKAAGGTARRSRDSLDGRALRALRLTPTPHRHDHEVPRAHRQGQVVRHRQGLRLPLPRRRRRGLRPPSTRCPPGVPALKPGARVEFGIVDGRRGEQALPVTLLDPLPSVAAGRPQAGRRHGGDRRGRDQAARRRRQLAAPGPLPRQVDRREDRGGAARRRDRPRGAGRVQGWAAPGTGAASRRCSRSSMTSVGRSQPRSSPSRRARSTRTADSAESSGRCDRRKAVPRL